MLWLDQGVWVGRWDVSKTLEKGYAFLGTGDGEKRGPSSETKGERARGRLTHQSSIDINEQFILGAQTPKTLLFLDGA